MPHEEPVAAAAYDRLAADYDEEVATGPYTAHLAKPGTIAHLPEPAGQRVLDAGCGTGVYTEWLADAGAEVVGLDVSAEMLAQARDRVGDRAELVRAALGAPIGLRDGAFDGIISVLALHYVADWEPVFEAFARLLRPGGFLVCTVTHPFDGFPLGEGENYFDVERCEKDWAVTVPYYRRPLSAVIEPILAAGFRLETVAEPRPTEGFRRVWPERYETESRSPVFLTLRAVLPR